MSFLNSLDALIQEHLSGAIVTSSEDIQSLWSGYGVIKRCRLSNSATPSVIVKHVCLPEQAAHPRGWNTSVSHQRKIRSYQVECAWYESFSQQCTESCRVPRCFGTFASDQEFLMVMEDLDAMGFSQRQQSLTLASMQPCLAWLAHFHATFMNVPPEGLWSTGTYWHLATRPDELEALDDLPLKRAAAQIDAQLSGCRFQTLVHGDAKLANFCFSDSRNAVAAVDFQYVGAGCGMKDLAYFVGSCLAEEECERDESQILDDYFGYLREALNSRAEDDGRSIGPFSALEAEWRPLYRVAWADFHRFVKGWSPGHWKINDYSERVVRSVLTQC